MIQLTNISKYIKFLGKVLVFISIFFIVKRFFSYQIPLEKFYSKEFLIGLLIAVIIQSFLVLTAFYPWRLFIEILSKIKIPILKTIRVFVTSNIYKYLPGNVFHIIGRNQLALDLKISHFNVAISTILDLLLSVFFVFLASIILLREQFFELSSKFILYNSFNFYIFLIVLFFLFFLFLIIFRNRIYNYLRRFINFIRIKNSKKLLYAIFYYCLSAFLYLFVYYINLKFLIGDSTSFTSLLTFTGAFAFSWVVGTITPGAPAGVGIREAIMLYICGSKFTEEIMVYIVLMRLATTLADMMAYIIGNIIIPMLFNNIKYS